MEALGLERDKNRVDLAELGRAFIEQIILGAVVKAATKLRF